MACDRATLISQGNCWTQQYFSEQRQNALIVYQLALWADSINGTTYSTTLTSTLLTNANNATCGMTDDQITAAFIGVLLKGIGGGAALTFSNGIDEATVAGKVAAIACLQNLTERQLRTMMLFLFCSIRDGLQ